MESFEILNTLGCGSYGKAILAESKIKKYKCVIKEIKVAHLNIYDLESAKKEVQVLSSLYHDHITKFMESFENDGSLYIVMEYCSGGDLKKFIDSRNGIYFPETRVLDWFIQLCLAVKFIHQRHIIHRDIKTQNVFLTDEGRIKLGDFGIAKILDKTSDLANTCIGTPYYLSPEMCENKPYSNKSDIWSVGCVLYEMLCLKHAYDASNIKALVIKIVKCSYPPLPSRYSRDLKMLVHNIFQRDPKRRPSITTILSKNILAKRLSRFASEADTEDLNRVNNTKTKVSRTKKLLSKRSALRSRIGISSPSLKYKNIPKLYVGYPNITRFSGNTQSSKRNSNYEKSITCNNKTSYPLNEDNLISNFPSQKNSSQDRSYSYPCKNSSQIQHKKQRSYSDDHKIKNDIQCTKKVNLIMKESSDSFKKIGISDSILLNLEKIKDNSNYKDLHNSSGWLVDLYLSQKLVTLQKDLKSNYLLHVLSNINKKKYCSPNISRDDFIPKINEKINLLVQEEINECCHAAHNRRRLAYKDEKNNLEAASVSHDNDLCYLDKDENFDHNYKEMNNHLVPTPSQNKLPYAHMYPPLPIPYHLFESETLSKEEVISQKNRRHWSNGPSDILSILASAKLQDPLMSMTSSGKQSLTKEDVTISYPISFINSDSKSVNKEILNENFKYYTERDGTLDGYFSKGNDDKTELSINNVCLNKIGAELDISITDKLSFINGKESDPLTAKDCNQSFSDTYTLFHNENFNTLQEKPINSITATCSSIENNEIINYAELKNDEKFDLSQDVSIDSSTPVSKKPKKKFFSFLQNKYLSETKEISNSSFTNKNLNDTLSTPKTRARFSSILKKFLQKESQSKSSVPEPPLKKNLLNKEKPFCSSTLKDSKNSVENNTFVSSYSMTLKKEDNKPVMNLPRSLENMSTTEDSGVISCNTNFTHSMASAFEPYALPDLVNDNKCNKTYNNKSPSNKTCNESDYGDVENSKLYTVAEDTSIVSDNIRYISGIELVVGGNMTQKSIVNDTKLLDDECKFENTFKPINKEHKSETNKTFHQTDCKMTVSVKNDSTKFPTNNVNIYNQIDEDYLHKAAFNLVENVFKTAVKKLEEKHLLNKQCGDGNFSLNHESNDKFPLSTFTNSNIPKLVWNSEDETKDMTDFMDKDWLNNQINFTESSEIQPFFIKRNGKRNLNSESLSEADVTNSLENLFSDDDVFEGSRLSVVDLLEPATPDGDINGWIEEQRAKFEESLGLDLFLQAYRCLENAYEENNSDMKEALVQAKMLIGCQHENLANEILQLIVTESIHLC